jgi:para-aminobenzoate synthetase/4-amino-4-deoxychorismate lyase
MTPVAPSSPFALFENHRAPDGARAAHLFWSPEQRIEATEPGEIPRALHRLRECTQAGLFVCGYVTYEAGYFLVDRPCFRLSKARERTLPLLGFFAFRHHEWLDPDSVVALLRSAGSAKVGVEGGPGAAEGAPCAVHGIELGESEEVYRAKVERIRAYIRDGDTYQVNHTFKCRLRYEGSAAALYSELRRRQPVEHGAYLDFPEVRVLSLSPELFLRKEGDTLVSKPMKGTARRGETPEEDASIVRALRADPKTLSENVMIVDLLRNDVGRLATPGSVRVSHLFEVQTFGTLHQMTSTVQGTVTPALSVGDALRGLFPCGSITGAPKIRTMQLIEELEGEPRGIYTGAVGYAMPDGDFCFNVPIRTLVSTVEGAAELGIGSGILHESDAAAEYEECLLKARFVTALNEKFQLVESMLFESPPGPRAGAAHAGAARPAATPRNLELHLRRVAVSAAFFGFRYDRARVLGAMAAAIEDAPPGAYKFRLALHHDGTPSFTLAGIDANPDADRPRVVVSPHRVDSRSVFQYHKTTVRGPYEREFERARALGAYDALFLNERGELAECSRHNIFVEIDEQWLTPPVTAGILAGVHRAVVLADPSNRAREAVLHAGDLQRAHRILLTNSVRGVVEAELSPR